MKKLLWTYLLGLLVGCHTVVQTAPPTTALLVASVVDNDEVEVYPAPIEFNFEDGTPVDYIEIVDDVDTGQIFLIRTGYSLWGECRVTRTQLIEQDGFFMLMLAGETEQCMGVHCSDCSFITGGCVCDEGYLNGVKYEKFSNRELLIRKQTERQL
jgi:hypothetical protein